MGAISLFTQLHERPALAFERKCKRTGITASALSANCQRRLDTTNDLAYPRRRSAVGVREGHGVVFVDSTNDVKAQ